jgi:endonuclease YncB( thermonuclease family)
MLKKFFAVFFILALFVFNKEVLAANPFIAVGAGQGSPQVKIFDLKGNLRTSFFVSAKDFWGGINLACGDVDGDKIQEIVVASRAGGSQIKIFSEDGKLKYPDFFAYDKNYYGGVDIALGDLDLDGKAEIIASQNKNGGSQVRIFDFEGKEKSNFYAFSKNFHGGLSLASGDIDRDGKAEIIIGTKEGVGSRVRIFSFDGKLKPVQYFPFSSDLRGGVSVAAGDIDGDGKDEIGMCQLNDGARCKVYRYNEDRLILKEWEVNKSRGGVKMILIDINRDGGAEIITSTLFGNPDIKAFKINGDIVPINFFDYERKYARKVDVAVFFDSSKDFGKVTYVDDGDTIFLNDGREIRYIGIDAPEIGKRYYAEATNRNKELVFEKEVMLEYDRQKIDPFGRHLAYVFVDRELINSKLLEEGYAKVKIFSPDIKYLNDFREAEKIAQQKKIGVWQNFEETLNNFLSSLLDKFYHFGKSKD